MWWRLVYWMQRYNICDCISNIDEMRGIFLPPRWHLIDNRPGLTCSFCNLSPTSGITWVWLWYYIALCIHPCTVQVQCIDYMLFHIPGALDILVWKSNLALVDHCRHVFLWNFNMTISLLTGLLVLWYYFIIRHAIFDELRWCYAFDKLIIHSKSLLDQIYFAREMWHCMLLWKQMCRSWNSDQPAWVCWLD